MADPAEGLRRIADMVEAGVQGMSAVSAALIVGAVVLVALLVWVVLGSVGEALRDRRRK